MKNVVSSLFGVAIFIVFISMSCAIHASNTVFPYYCSFENETDTVGWKFVGMGGLLPSEWYWGDAVGKGSEKSVYVSADGGTTAGYKEAAAGYYIVVYKKIIVQPMTKYDIAFDCKVGGEKGRDGSVNDGMMAVWMPVSKGQPLSNFGGAQFPAYAKQYGMRSGDGRSEFSNNGWNNVVCTVDAFENEYYLAFVWKANGSKVKDIGACVDNIQLAPQRKGECAERPLNVKAQANADKSGYTVTWSGNADSYEIQYYRTDSPGVQKVHSAGNLKGNSYTINLANAPEGVYSVLVRSVCGGDTSVWSELSNVMLYDESAHCVDYVNLMAEDVVCTKGTFQNPYETVGVVDNGYYSETSIHTIHYVPDEYDPRTNYMLKTVPEGAMASVRISNWQEQPAGSASITYNYQVTEESDVLKVQYAAVLQYASGHPANDQTRIIVEIFDAATGTLLSECTRSEFNAKDVNQDNVRRWHEFAVKDHPVGLLQDSNTPIMWCDWSVIGINLEPYIGMNLKIRYTLKACVANFHFAYAYFTLDCDKSEIDGITCGEHPEVFRVPEGFIYRWYEKKNPEVTVGTADSLVIAPNDTVTYSVDLIFPENEKCYFTLEASALPREPIADMDYEIVRKNCQNIVKIKNKSRIFGFWEGDTIDTGEKCGMHVWNFHDYGVATDYEPEIIVPAEGDTFAVALTAAIDKGLVCVDSREFVVEVPSMALDTTFVSYFICDSAKVVHDGQEYTEEERVTLRYENLSGCDSIVVLDIRKLVVDTVIESDSVCSAELPVMFHGQELSESGHYEHIEKNLFGCDSVVYVMDLLVNSSLAIDLNGAVDVCADDLTYSIEYSVHKGVPTNYSLLFGEAEKAEGFSSEENVDLDDISESLLFDMPKNIRPGKYTAELKFFNDSCGDVSFPVALNVLYPSSVITQRWNDVLAVLNKDYNGGYEFSGFQWYVNDTIIENANGSIHYAPGGLRIGAQYRVELTRSDDGVRQFTCGFYPQTLTKPSEDAPTVVFAGSVVAMESSVQGKAYIYNMGGILESVSDLVEGVNTIVVPQQPGIYILQIVSADEIVSAMKIVVQ